MASSLQDKPFRDLTRAEMRDVLIAENEPGYRGDQVYEWIWQKGVTSFEEMSNLSKSLRFKLKEKYTIATIQKDIVQRSSDGTIKVRFRLQDGAMIESVLIPVLVDKRFTVCVSSQLGCSLSCKFCATGQMREFRNLKPFEISDQVAIVNRLCLEIYQKPLTNIVFMGMGEPLLNYKNVLTAIEHITSPDELAFSPRRITVSTAGIIKMIRKLADDQVRFNLALSLHAATEEKRNQIMPINESNDLPGLMSALEHFSKKTRSKITFEYIAFQNFNDTLADAQSLASLCTGLPVSVNIIEYNRVEGLDFHKAEDDSIDSFAGYLTSQGVTVTVRRSRGRDIDAACGQLANRDQ